MVITFMCLKNELIFEQYFAEKLGMNMRLTVYCQIYLVITLFFEVLFGLSVYIIKAFILKVFYTKDFYFCCINLFNYIENTFNIISPNKHFVKGF